MSNRSTIYISAIGHARPDQVLPSDFIEPSDRRTILRPDYISSTGNQDPFIVLEHLNQTPTELALQATKMALARADQDAESIELIIGASSTPLQTIPTESQRLGKMLDLKVPAYDLHGGGADLILQLEALSQWRSERIPSSTLLVAAHAPTTRLNFRSGLERAIFSDGAAALIVNDQPGGFEVTSTYTLMRPDLAHLFKIAIYGHLEVQDLKILEEDYLYPMVRDCYLAVKDKISKDALFIESNFTPNVHNRLREDIAPSAKWSTDYQWVSDFSSNGNILSASSFISFSSIWDTVAAEQVVVISSGIGLSAGIVVLNKGQ
jgi:3-oxoacyl-[acyl-carrier-protein] synthase III